MARFIVLALTALVALAGLYVYVHTYAVVPGYGAAAPASQGASAVAAIPASGSPALIETSIGEGATALGLSLTPLALVSDTRCPLGGTCIAPGFVRVETRVGADANGAAYVFTSWTPETIAGRIVTLTGVAPVRETGKEIPADAYRFTFRVEYAGG
ncbi:MAG: hypothetical protein KGI41_00855 [Patescibacteria group bacterium]|nr:hypothetical protein [Patescibacteria group bacterium]MDE1965778.1 hypothetical protein [Patescibacteria group bacterium]